MPIASPALVPTFITFDDDDDDDDFGEFEFAPTGSAPPPPPHRATSNQQQWQQAAAAGEGDDDWGDFVESPLQPHPFSSPEPPPPSSSSSSSAHFAPLFDPFPAAQAAEPDPTPIHSVPQVAAGKGWQKPSGALPLSLFGGEDAEAGGGGESPDSLGSLFPDLKVGPPFASSKSPGCKGSSVSAQGEGLQDLIASLYGQAGVVTPGKSNGNCDGSKINGNCEPNPVSAENCDNGEDDLDEGGWEFQDAISIANVGDSSDSVLLEEGELVDIPAVEPKATDSDSEIQTSGNYIWKSNGQESENVLGDNLPSKALSNAREWGSTFVSHGTTVNGFGFGFVDYGSNACTSNAHQNLEHINMENGLDHNVANGDMSLDDSFWKFKDASSEIEILNHFTQPESIDQRGLNEPGNSYTSIRSNENQDFVDPFLITEGCPHVPNSIDNGMEGIETGSVVGHNDLVSNMYNGNCNISAVTSMTHSEQNSVVSCETLKGADNFDLKYSGLESDKIRHNDFASKNTDTYFNISIDPRKLGDFYSRLKQVSCMLALRHIENHKLTTADGKEVPDEELEAVDLDDVVMAAFSKLGIAALKSDHREKHPPNEISVSELLEVIQEPGFQAFDMEYRLSEKIPLAEKDLSSAVWLFEHAASVLYTLTMASCEEQHAYINSWSKIISACELELQHGATIWSLALHANIQTQLISESRGQHYFLALGEIYRVVEILSASIRLYKPWILLNPADSRDMLACRDKSVDSWRDCRLKQALEIISESSGKLKAVTEELVKSIKFISELSTHTLQNHLSSHDVQFCRISLLPLKMLPDIKQLVWHGDLYFCKLANFWTNRISSDVPQLPRIHVGR